MALAGDRPPFGGGSRPRGGDRPPFGGDSRPRGGGRPPFGNDSRPRGGDRPPFGNDSRPRGGDRPPFGNDSRPRGSGRPPFGGDSRPRGGGRPPFDAGSRPPGGRPRTEGEQRERNVNPTRGWVESTGPGPSRRLAGIVDRGWRWTALRCALRRRPWRSSGKPDGGNEDSGTRFRREPAASAVTGQEGRPAVARWGR